MVSVLLDYGVNVEAQDKVSDSSFGNNDFIYLSSHFECLYLFWQTQMTPLHLACLNGRKDVVSVLLDRGANMEAQTEVSDSSFDNNNFIYLSSSHFECLYLFWQDQWTPLHVACKNGHKDVVLVLLDHGVNVEAQNEVSDFSFDNNNFIYLSTHFECLYLFWQIQETPLHIACEKGRKDIVSVLLDHGANMEAQNKESNQIFW